MKSKIQYIKKTAGLGSGLLLKFGLRIRISVFTISVRERPQISWKGFVILKLTHKCFAFHVSFMLQRATIC